MTVPARLLRWAPLSAILLVALALRLWLWVGPTMTWLSDDSRYAAVIRNMANGHLPEGPTEWFGTRVGLLTPVAGLFRLFGGSDLAMGLWPLVGSLAAVLAAFLIGREIADQRVGLLAAAFVAVAPVEVRLGMILQPDALMPAMVALSVWCALRAARSDQYWWRWAFGAGIALGAAWTTRENALVLAPIVLLAAWPRLPRALIPGVLGTLAIPSCAAVVWGLAGGNPLAPFWSAGGELDARNPIRAWSFDESYLFQLGDGALTHRSLLFLALPAVLSAVVVLWMARDRRAVIPAIWLLVGYLYLEFGTLINLTKPYRYLTMLIVPAALLLALALSRLPVWIPLVVALSASLWVLSALPVRDTRADDVLLFSRVSNRIANLPPGPIATESFTWWNKLQIYHARSRLSVPKVEDTAFVSRQRARQLRRMVPLPSIQDARYLVVGPVHPRRNWPSNWDTYRANFSRDLPRRLGMTLVADLGRAQIWQRNGSTR